MVIDIQGNTAQQRARATEERRQVVFRAMFIKSILPILKRQYKDAAENIDSYNFNYNWAVEKYHTQLLDTYRRNYKRILTEFGEKILDDIFHQKGYIIYERKSFVEDFWRFAIPWMNVNTATKVVQVTNTTKKHINLIVKKGMKQDKTNREIANNIKEISEISTPLRAMTIARTETHSAASYATDKAMETSRLMKEKSWISALDERTRTLGSGSQFDHVAANGERVAMEDTFKRTGENLRYPGDYENGSAGNIIRCRCQALYYTNIQTIRQ